MHTKLKFAILTAFSAAAFAAAPVHAAYSVYSDPDCGPKVESSAWFIDYSGTMQEKLREPEEKSYPDWAKGKEKEGRKRDKEKGEEKNEEERSW